MNEPPIRASLAVLALLLALLSALLLWRHDRLQRVEQEALLRAVAGTVADQVGLALDYGIPFSALRGMEPFLDAVLAANPELAGIGVAAADGTARFARGAPDGGGLAVTVAIATGQGEAGGVRVSAARGLPGGWLGPGLGLIDLLTLALAWAGLRHAGRRRVARPLAALEAALAAIGRGDFSPPPQRGRGEIAGLEQAAAALVARVTGRATAFRQEIEERTVAQPDAAARAAIAALGRDGTAGLRFGEEG
ncbi:hypothetical protein [Phaeospirillum tilakii]|uniref:HAMP domain-containing protein n=1 Tax=Phaeospirillum tilakii TaxID=741673 RepID=A0ABW5CCI1_9PROT